MVLQENSTLIDNTPGVEALVGPPRLLLDGTPAVMTPPPGTRKGGFWKGQPPPLRKYSKARMRSRRLKFLADMCKEHKLISDDPIETLCYIGMVGHDPLEEHFKELAGTEQWEKFFPKQEVLGLTPKGYLKCYTFVNLETRVDCIKAALPYMYPRLTSAQINLNDGAENFEARSGLVQAAAADPEARAALEKLQERMAVHQVAQEMSEEGQGE